MAFDGIFFDLDGTLWDAVDNIVTAWQSVCAREGENRFSSREGTLGLMGMSCEEIREEFRKEFGEKGESLYLACIETENALVAKRGGHIYEGVEEMLKALAEKHFLAVVSNCQEGYIESFLSYSGLGKYFGDFLAQGTTHLTKGENIRIVAERNGLHDVLYLGDTERDEAAARLAGCTFVHAAYGFGEAEQPDGVVHTPSELVDFVAAAETARNRKTTMLIDTHAHYDDAAFDTDRAEVLAALKEQNVGLVIDPAVTVETSRTILRLAEEYSFLYAAVGIHPENCHDYRPEDIGILRILAQHPKCVAIGEIGLDYHWEENPAKELQMECFSAQLRLAEELRKPVIIHDRDAHADCLKIVADFPEVRGVFHCYSGSAEMAKELLKKGWYLGFDGPLTYKNARRTLETAELCPLDRILIETDSPYLSPEPKRGERNDSRNLRCILAKLAEIKGISIENMERITAENARRLFSLYT